MKLFRISFVFLFCMLLCAGISLNSASAVGETVWTGAKDANWFNAENWSGGTVPTAAADVYLGNGANVSAYMTTTNMLNAKAIHLTSGSMLSVTSVAGQFNLARQGLMSVEGGILYWNNESRIVSEVSTVTSESFRQTGGVVRATGTFGSMNGGTINLSGGIFTQSLSNGELIVGLDKQTVLNFGGTSLTDVSNLCIGARNTGANQMNISGGTLLVRGAGYGWCQGMTVGGGDNNGTGTVNPTGGKVNILSSGGLFVGSDAYNAGVSRNVTGTMNISGGEMNVQGTVSVGKTNASSTAGNKGTLTLSGNGILRAGTITVGGNSTMNFIGGTLSAGTYNGDFTNAGSIIAPETWTEAQNTSPTTYVIGGNTYKAADEYGYSQTSRFGATTISGTFTQTAGVIQFDYDSEALRDSLTAASFNITGGTLMLNYGGVVTNTSGAVTLTGLFNAVNTGAANTFNFSQMNITDAEGHHLIGDIAANGALTLNYGTITWTGTAGNGNFFTAGNWDTNMVSPSGNRYGVVIGSGTVNANISSSAKIYGTNIRLENGGILNVRNGNATDSQNGAKSFTVAGGTLDWSSNARVIYEEKTLTNTVYEQTSGTSSFNGEWTSFNGGTLEISGGSFLQGYSSNGILNLGLENSAIMNVSGNAFVSAKSLTLGLRNYGSAQPSELNMKGGTLLVRADGTAGGYGTGLLIGYGNEASGNGSLNLSGGTINVLAAGKVEVGSATAQAAAESKGVLNISGGVLNAAGTMTVGNTAGVTGKNRTGSVSLTGGTLRAAAIQLGAAGASASWTGGTLTVGSYTGADFVNNGAVLAPETWTFTSGTAKTANEKYYTQTSKFGTSTFSGTFTQNSGSVSVDLGLNADRTALSDVITAKSFTFSGGSVNVSYSGSAITGSEQVTYTVFRSTDASAVNTWLSALTYDASVKDNYYVKYDSATGKITLSAADSLIWNGTSGNWNTASGWNQNRVPTTAYNTYILTGTVTNAGTMNAKTLTVGGSGTLNVTSDVSLNVGKFILENGGTMNWNPGSRLVQSNANSVADSADYVFEMRGGKVNVTNEYTTFASGKVLFSGGLLRQTNTRGTLILGLTGNTVTDINGNAQIDAVNVCAGGRYNENYTSKKSVVNVGGSSTILVRANTASTNITENAVGLVLGSGDNSGNGTMNVTENSTVNILQAGNVYVGAATRSVNAVGTLNVAGGTLNAAGNIYVGKYLSAITNNQTGKLSVSGGTLRAGTISIAAGSTAEFTGGRLVIGTFNGDFTNSGATLAPESWSFTRDASKSNTALEYVYERNSEIGMTTILGDYIQNNRSASMEISLSQSESDVILADNFDVTDGILTLIYSGEYDGSEKAYNLFRTNDVSGLKTLNFADIQLEGLDAAYYFDAGTGTFYLGRDMNSVPEPGTWGLLLLGISGLIFVRKRS